MESFKKDLKRKELIPIKILMFLIYGGQATLYPYFTVHLKSLGVSIKHTAIIFAVQPIIALLVAPMVGMLADKIGNFKLIFSFFLTFSAITSNMLLFVPAVPAQEKLLYLSLSCKSNAEAEFRFLTDKSCSIIQEERNSYLNMTLEFHCEQNYLSNTEKGQPSFYLQNEEKCQNHCSNSSIDGCTIVEEDSAFYFFLNASYLFNTEDQESQITQRSENISQRLLNSDAYFISYENKTYDALTCSCFSSQRNGTLCTFVSKEPVENCLTEEYEEFGITFWTYLSIRLIVTLGIGLVNGLFDAASMAIIQKLKADVGFQRFWSTVAMCLMAPISGYFVDEYDTFKPCFFMYGALYLIAAFTSLKLDLSMKLPSENPLRNLALLIRNPEVILLLMQIAVLGICWGFLENFLFWFLESELEANNLIMGLTVTVGSGTGLFMALVATWFTKKLGYVNVIIVAFIAYTVRFFGYALAMDAYTCLIFEMMENFTVTLLTVGVTLYCTELASLEMLTTIMTLWNGLHIISE
ncbi:uncharacterized protein LOC118205350 [Stegodyphus dumicola]|uniref:uncharacterized protein LOC118205350 n=1 Tax=Stegodyphus dumicola TaxID=202533 RepID=UPI0015AD50F0|nr:uncharacterized protein LOC118205350 [Stegodyphus dumicola]